MKKIKKKYEKKEKSITKKKEKERKKNDPEYKLHSSIRSSIKSVIKRNGGKKDGKSSIKYVPYTFQELQKHLESLFEPWMTWENWGKYDPKTWNDNDQFTWKWQLDHIIPQSDLPYATLDDENFHKCWSLSNLRPLSAKQ